MKDLAREDEGKLALEVYEEEILLRMYDARIIGGRYVAIEKLRRIVKWDELQATYNIKKKFERVIRRLHSKGYIDFHGKSGDVASLASLAVTYVLGLKKSQY